MGQLVVRTVPTQRGKGARSSALYLGDDHDDGGAGRHCARLYAADESERVCGDAPSA
jgi:hypothetical protein